MIKFLKSFFGGKKEEPVVPQTYEQHKTPAVSVLKPVEQVAEAPYKVEAPVAATPEKAPAKKPAAKKQGGNKQGANKPRGPRKPKASKPAAK